jgi:membrane protease YdiL (CAAX protease family)
MEAEARERLGIVVLGVLLEGALGLVAWGVGWWLGRPVLKSLRWEGRDALLGIAASGPLFGVLALSLKSRWRAFVKIRQFFDDIIRPLLGPCSVVELALLALAAGFGEELLFRGLIQGALTDRFGFGIALALASLAFGLLHPITPAYLVLAALMGAYLGLVWRASGNLLVAIIAHALYDFLALLIVLRATVPQPTSALAQPVDDAPSPVDS